MEIEEQVRLWHNAAMKKYYQRNPEKYHQKHNCKCGGKYTINNKSKHESSIKHQEYISTLPDEN